MTMRRIAGAIVVVLLALLAAGKPVSAEQVLLRHKFFPPRDLVYDFWISATATVSGSALAGTGQQQKQSGQQIVQQTVNGRLAARIESVDSHGNGTLTFKLGRLGMETTAKGQSTHMTLDPARGIIQANGQIIALGELQQVLCWIQTCKLTISPRGKVLIVPAPVTAPTPTLRRVPLPLLSAVHHWQRLLEAIPPWLPEQPVRVGDKWGMNIGIPTRGGSAGQPAHIGVHYTLERIGEIDGDRIARIAFQGAVAYSDVSIPVPRGATQRTPAGSIQLIIDQHLAGQLYFNLDNGQMHSARGDGTVTVQVQRSQRQQSQASPPPVPGLHARLSIHFEVFPGKG